MSQHHLQLQTVPDPFLITSHITDEEYTQCIPVLYKLKTLNQLDIRKIIMIRKRYKPCLKS